MSDLSMLVVASMGAALAFFVAGLLLRRPRSRRAEQQAVALEGELANLRAEHQHVADELAEARQRSLTGESERKLAEKAQLSAERERDGSHAEYARLAAREKTLAERLRAAEDSGRAALEQVETNAAAWDARWQAATADRQRHEQTLRGESEQLRARYEVQAKEHTKLLAAYQKLETEKAEAQRAAAEAARKLAEAPVRASEDLAKQAMALEEEARRLGHKEEEVETREREVRTSLEQSAAAWRQRLEHTEAEWQAKLANQEAAWQAKARAAEAASHGGDELGRLSRQLRELRAEHASEREQRQRIELVLRASEETLAAEHVQAESTAEALHAAEARLRDLQRLARENAELRSERDRLVEAAKAGAGREGEAKDAKVELAAAQAKLAELGQVLEENRKLRDQVAELRAHQEATGELERLTATHKQLRLDAELMARRLQELEQDRAELAPLRAQAAEAASLQEEVAYLRRREKDLEAQLYANGFFASREMPAISGEQVVQTPVSNMETALDSLLVDGGPRTAVLADAQGFLIAGAGESVAQEGLAAFAAVAGDLVSRARMLLPLADVSSVRLTDANSMVLTCHLFDSDWQGLEIATLGPGEPPAESTQQTIAGLSATLSSGDSAKGDDGAT